MHGNAASISLIFAANVSLFTSTTKIRGALNGLDSLMSWDFGLLEIPIVVVEFETTANFERDVSINEESIPQNLDSITDVTSSCSVEADWTDLAHYPQLLMLRVFPCLKY